MRILPSLVLAAAGLGLAPLASATVLSFDDIGAAGSSDVVPANYGGLDWSQGSWFYYDGEQAPYSAHSGDFRIATWGDDNAATIGFGSGDVFQGAWFAGYGDATVTLQMYYQGQLVATSATLDPTATSTFLASGYTGLVDQVVVSSPYQGGYVMDDLTFTAPVPEPASAALLLAGLGLLATVARRRA